MNRKLIIEKLIIEGFSERTLSRLSDNELSTLSKTVLKEAVMIKKDNVKDIAAAKAAGKTIETYESKVCPKCGMKNCKCKDKKHGDVNEKWEGDTKVKKTGEHAGKTVSELKKELNSLKEKSKKYQDEGKKVPKKIIDQEAELKFAIRAKQGWKKKMNESSSEVEEWVLDLTESKYSQFTSKNDIMNIISEKMETTFQPMPATRAKKGHNGVPEFMTYDSIMAAAQPSPSPVETPTKPDVDTPTRPQEDEPWDPFEPQPGPDTKPKALAEKKKIKK
jgi:hypothetical protein